MSDTVLSALPMGQRAVVEALTTAGEMRRRLLDLGLTPGAAVEALFRGRGGIAAYRVRGAVIALRKADADGVRVALPGHGGAAAWV